MLAKKKKIIVFFCLLSLIALVTIVKNDKKVITKKRKAERHIYELAVMLKDQNFGDQEENRKSALKRGDVASFQKEGHIWTKMEKVSYLIIKIDLFEDQVVLLTKAKKENGQIVMARQYAINMDEFKDIVPLDLLKGQPGQRKVYDWGMVVEK